MRTSFNKIDSFRLFGLQVCLTFVASLLVAAIFANFADNALSFWAVQLGVTLAFGALTFAYSRLAKANYFVANGLTVKPKIVDMLFAVAAVFFLVNAMTPVNEWFCDLIEMLGLNRPDIAISSEMFTNQPIFAVATVCIVAPILEEITFRGTIGRGLGASCKSKVQAIVVSGLLFALFHMNPAQTIHQAIVGMLMTAFALFGSVWVAIVGHIFNNLLAVVLSLTVEPTGFYQQNAVVVAVVGLVLFAATVTAYFFYLKKNNRLEQTEQASGTTTAIFDKGIFAFGVIVAVVVWVATLFA